MPQSIRAILSNAGMRLKEISDSPMLDAELILAHCLEKNRSFLHTWPENQLDNQQLECFESHIRKRLSDYPVAYILGYKAFWTFELIVTEDVLIPRPETELLVELALEKISAVSHPKILDLGTGSGAIALALASESKDAKIIATDYSEKALKVASQNATNLKLDHQVEFKQSDWFSNINDYDVDLIVSNPPYIDADDEHLQQSIRFEPISALVAENHGMRDIEIIISESRKHLKDKAWIMLEHGFEQHSQTQQIFNQYHFKNVESVEDLNGNMRVTMAQYQG